MFIPEHYVLSSELHTKYKISQSVFSMLKKKLDESNTKDAMIKYGNCLFVNSRSYDLPKSIRKMVQDGEYTRMDNKLVSTYVCSEFNCSKSELISGLKEFDAKEVKVQGKSFIEFDTALKDMFKNKIVTNIDAKDLSECLNDQIIDGFIRLGSDNFLVWY